MKLKRIAATVTALILTVLTFMFVACEGKKVTVSFDFDDGINEIRTVEISAGTTVEEPTEPSREGHIFTGWYLDGEEFDFSEPVEKDITLVAEWEENIHIVTVVYYEGREDTEEVMDGEKFERPLDRNMPEREGYEFDDWYSDAAHTRKYNFDAPVRGDITIYGNWKDVSVTYFDVTYNYYEGADSRTTPVEEGQKAVRPADPVRANYTFLGWFTAAEGGTEYDFDAPVTADTQIYAHWEAVVVEGVKTYAFDAELTDLSELQGSGFSNEAPAEQAIQNERAGDALNANNGYWVGYMYVKGYALTFNFNSDKEVNDATLKLRLSGEIVKDVTVKSDEFTVEVNGRKLNYNDITITDIPRGVGQPPAPFRDYEVATNLNLKKGPNKIVLTVNNNVPLKGSDGQAAGGKIQATAPLVDCIKITTSANLSWTPWTKGLEKKYGWDPEIDYAGILLPEEHE